MAAIHRIRLQGPWQVLPPRASSLPAGDSPSDIRTVQLPATWRELFGEVSGIAIFQRRFNRPTNLQADDQVLIRLPERCGLVRTCLLNGNSLRESAGDPHVFDATPQLQEFNQLELQIEFTLSGEEMEVGGLWRPVLLEIVSE